VSFCRSLLPCALLYLACAAPVAAQTATATLFVDAHDAAGAPLVGVEVRLANQATRQARAVTTTGEGTASVPLLAAGVYDATATLGGYKQAIVRDLRLDAGGKGTLDLVLVPGDYTESVVVSADASTLRAGGGAIGESFDGRTLVMMPMNDRNFLQFTYQVPGAAPPAPGSRLSSEGNAGVNVSGAREAANNFLLDGTDNNDWFLNRLVTTPSLDAVQEFAVVQNTYDAEYGRNAGAQVNVVLKSGGAETHGSLFEYFRHESLDARGAFDPPGEGKPRFRRSQFGGTIGGRLGFMPGFYFLSAEVLRTESADTRVTSVPTLAERTGDFSASANGLRDPLTGAPFPGNRIPGARLDPAGVQVASLYPEPNRSDPARNLRLSPPGKHDGVQFAAKTDHRLWRRTPFFVRYALTSDDRDTPFPAHGRNLPGFGIGTTDVGHNLAAGWSQTWSPHVLNELRAGWNRLHRENLPQSSGTDMFPALGIAGPPLAAVDQGYPSFVLAGYEPLGDDPNLPVVRRTGTLHVSDSVTIDHGRHLVKLGGELRHYGSDGFNHLFSRGQISFDGSYTGDALGDLLLGMPSLSLLAANDNPQALRTTAWNLFIQDDWHPSSSLTVTAGLRYELNSPPVDAHDRMRIFDVDTLSLADVGQGGVPRSGVRTDWTNLAPRLGLAWVLPGRTGITLRAGYGLYYDSGTLIENSALYFNPPYFDLRVYAPFVAPLTLADPFPSSQAFSPLPSVNSLDPDFRTAMTRQGSVGLERSVRGIDLGLRYVGAHGSHLVRRRNINQPVPGAGDLDARRPIAGFADILLVEPAASSSYHALQVRAERQRVSGLSFRLAYTWSKSLDDASAFLQSDGNDNTPQDARHPERERGLSDFDVRHRLSLGWVWMLPSSGKWAWTHDWQISGIVAAQSGRPFTPRVGFDNSHTGNVGGSFGYDRPNEVDPAAAGPDAVRYGGRAFVVAPSYTFGDAGRNILAGPASASVDLAVGRNLRLGGERRLELRAEVYNALNRTNYGLPESFVDRPTFGQSVSAAAPRQVQLVARLMF
jgi:hypothetical protein